MKKISWILATAVALACQNKEETATYEAFPLSSLDTTVSPCSDFFQYTAGGWIANNPIPDTEGKWGTFNQLADQNRERIMSILEEYAGKKNLKKGSDEQLVGDFYFSGMDSLGVEKAGISSLKPYVDKVNTMASATDMAALMANNLLKGIDAPFYVMVMADLQNSAENALYIGPSGLGMPDRDYYLKTDEKSEKVQEAYKKHITNMLSLYGMDKTSAEQAAQTVYRIEYQLAEKTRSREEMRNIPALYNPQSFDQLKKSAPAIAFDQYFNTLNIQFEQIIVMTPEYFTALDKIMKSTSLADWKTYLTWHTIHGAAPYLPFAFEKEHFEFYSKTLEGAEKMNPRWKRVQEQIGGLDEQIGHLYIKKYFSEDSKKRVEQMVEDLRSAYRDRINRLTWMSDTTKEKALEKLNAFTYKIGYPNKWKDYSSLDINRNNYLQNAFNLNDFTSRETFAKLGKPVDRGEWGMGAHVVNAYYNPMNNEVVFPAGILQPPFFDPKADDALNYGAIGGVIGHEFTHGFDDQGSEFDASGNMVNWWTEGDKARFKELTNSLADQYNKYEVLPGVFVNGRLTLGENIADLGGLTLAYYAYLKHQEKQPQVEFIDGFSPAQRVFLGWAQVWQSHAKEEYLRNQVTTDPHSPARFRVIGPVKNMPEFDQAFGCKEQNKNYIMIW